MLPSIVTNKKARLSKSAPSAPHPHNNQNKRILPVLTRPGHKTMQSAPPTGRLKKAPSRIKLRGSPAALSPRHKRVVISTHKTTTFNYTILPGNNTRVVMNCFRLRPWWRSNPKVIPTNHFIWEMFRNRNRYKTKKYRRVMLNHIQRNHALVTKNGLYLSLKAYCTTAGIELSTIVPQTFYLSSSPDGGDRDTELEEFVAFNKEASGGEGTSGEEIIWILKPAFAANQGCGIRVVSGLEECLQVVGCQRMSPRRPQKVSLEDEKMDVEEEEEEEEDVDEEGGSGGKRRAPRTTEWIVQRYMKEPLLVRGRKFDIRCFVLVVLKNSSKLLPDGSPEGPVLKAYLYSDGYVRTSGKKYTLNNLSDRETHLTNDAVQKKAKNYGKFESANKLNYEQFQDVINQDYPSAPAGVVQGKILPQIKYQVIVSLRAAKDKLEDTFINKSFELLGYDFMVDADFESTLIEINSNPSLEMSGEILEDMIPRMVENTFQLSIDALMPPPASNGARSQKVQECIDCIESMENRYVDLMI